MSTASRRRRTRRRIIGVLAAIAAITLGAIAVLLARSIPERQDDSAARRSGVARSTIADDAGRG